MAWPPDPSWMRGSRSSWSRRGSCVPHPRGSPGTRPRGSLRSASWRAGKSWSPETGDQGPGSSPLGQHWGIRVLSDGDFGSVRDEVSLTGAGMQVIPPDYCRDGDRVLPQTAWWLVEDRPLRLRWPQAGRRLRSIVAWPTDGSSDLSRGFRQPRVRGLGGVALAWPRSSAHSRCRQKPAAPPVF